MLHRWTFCRRQATERYTHRQSKESSQSPANTPEAPLSRCWNKRTPWLCSQGLPLVWCNLRIQEFVKAKNKVAAVMHTYNVVTIVICHFVIFDFWFELPYCCEAEFSFATLSFSSLRLSLRWFLTRSKPWPYTPTTADCATKALGSISFISSKIKLDSLRLAMQNNAHKSACGYFVG